MTRMFVTVCDGCDRRAEYSNDEPPPKFVKTSISINGDKRPEFDLCQTCFERILSQSNPKGWTRPAAVRAA